MSWKKVNISSISEQIRGVSYKPSDLSNTATENHVPVLRANNVTENGIKLDDFVYVNRKRISKHQVLKSGDILIVASSGSKAIVGRAISIEKDMNASFGAFCKIVRPNNKVDKGYLGYYFRSSDYRRIISHLSAGANINNLRSDDINTLQIPLPPLHIQKQIANILDKADALRKKDQQLLQKYDELAQSIFIDMFGDPVKNEKGWEVKKLNEICTEIIDCPHSTPIHVDSITNYPCIRTSEMENGRIVWNSMKYLDASEYQIRTKRLKPIAGDIVYAREGTFGEAILVPEFKKFALGQRTMLFRPNSEICDNVFLWFQINSDFMYRQALRKTNGSTVGHINVSDIKEFDVVFPDIEKQKEFSNAISLLLASQDLQLKQSNLCNNLFQSLLQKAFTGELIHD